MVVDIAPQQQLNEVFTTNRTHHRSSSSTHRRNSTTTNHTSSLVSNNNNTMTNGHRFLPNELGKKAEQILGHATAFLGCGRQTSIDLHTHYPPRLNITESKSSLPSRSTITSTASSTIVHNLPTATTSSSLLVNTLPSNSSIGKNKPAVTAEHLVPLILQLVAAPSFVKFPEILTRRRSSPKSVESVLESRKMTLDLHRESVVKLSDDENDDDNSNNPNTVLTDITDNKINNNNSSRNSNNSNDNHPYHSYENQIESQHSGISSSRCQEDEEEDSEDKDSDNQEAAHSDAENDDGTNETNPDTLSLMDFVRQKETLPEPVDSSSKYSPESLSNIKKRSISPEIKREDTYHVHNSIDHQNKRKKILIKRALLKSFISSVNTKINFKQPSLPITIPTHLFLDSSLSESVKQEDEQSIERLQRTSKRYANGLPKHDTHTDVIDNLSQLSSSSVNNQTTPINGIHQKKNKTSHVQDKIVYKQEPSSLTSITGLKNEQITISNLTSTNEIDSKSRTTLLSTATVHPTITTQPKKEKPTANVKPLQQSTPIDNLSSTNSITNGINISDSLTTANTRSILPATKSIYTKLKNMSKADLASLARKKKKQADHGKRTTFEEAREAMGLYLESVCYFIQCANDETKQDQRAALLTSTLTMLQQLAQNHKKMFCLANLIQSNDLQQKFLLINYWLQSLIYYLQFNTNISMVDRCANQVTEYFNQLKNPSSAASLTRTTNFTIQQQSTPINDNNPISPLSTTSQTSSSDISTTSGNTNSMEPHRYMYDFSKFMLQSYHSTYYWNKAESLTRDKSLKEFTEQLLKQNQNRRLSRDDTTLNFLLYIFDAIELLRLSAT